MDSLNLENEFKRIETNGNTENSNVTSDNTNETENKNNLLNGKHAFNETLVDNSVDSSTDTLVPNGDVFISKINRETEG